MEMGIRPTIWLAEFSKNFFFLHGATKWVEHAYVLSFLNFHPKNYIKNLGIYDGKHYIII